MPAGPDSRKPRDRARSVPISQTFGIVAVSVEDDAILLLHGYLEVADDGCRQLGFSPMQSLARPLTATSDGFGPQEGESRELLADWREHAPEKVTEHVRLFVEDCLNEGTPVHAVGVSMFGNVDTMGAQSINHNPGQGKRAGEIIPINIPRELDNYFAVRGLASPKVTIVNDATAMAVGEALLQKEARPDLFACIWMGKGLNGGMVFPRMKPWEGFMHPEMGHLRPRFHDDDDIYLEWLRDPANEPSCFTHRDCLLSLVSRRSLLLRRERGLSEDRIEDIVAYYIAQLCLSITLVSVPGRIAIGGYLMRSSMLTDVFVTRVRLHFNDLLNGFPCYAQIHEDNVSDYIVRAEGGDLSALRGVVQIMGDRLLEERRRARPLHERTGETVE